MYLKIPADKPALTQRFVKQAIMASLTLPRAEGEADDAYIARIIADSRKEGTDARDVGTEIHAAIDRHDVAGEWDYLRCSSCNIVSLQPFPDEGTLRRAYPDDYSCWTEQGGSQNLLHRLRGIFMACRNRQLARLIPSNGAVLDVGAPG